MEGHRVKLTEVNPYLVCVLCHGYLVDATTIAECLHSFCRSCIFRQLERKSICPICETHVHNTKLYRSLRPDKTLQDIVYKLVPGLFHNEMQRRRDFYKNHPHRDEHLEPECRGVGLDRLIYSPDDHISLSLEIYDEEREKEEWSNNSSPKPPQFAPSGPKRYLQCPAGFKMFHLKKFLRQKYGLSNKCNVDIIFRRECLPDSYSLMDVAYIYTWKRNSPMRFYFRMPEVIMKQLMAPRPLPAIEDTKDSDTAKEEKESITKSPIMMDEVVPEEMKEEKKENSEAIAPEQPKVEQPDKVEVTVKEKIEEEKMEVEKEKSVEVVEQQTNCISTPRALSKQDELSVSVLLSLGQCLVDNKDDHKFLKPHPVVPKNGIVEKKNGKVNPKPSVNKIAADLAEHKAQQPQPQLQNSTPQVLPGPLSSPNQQLTIQQKQQQLQKQKHLQHMQQQKHKQQLKQQQLQQQKQQQFLHQKQQIHQLMQHQQQKLQQQFQQQQLLQQQQLQHIHLQQVQRHQLQQLQAQQPQILQLQVQPQLQLQQVLHQIKDTKPQDQQPTQATPQQQPAGEQPGVVANQVKQVTSLALKVPKSPPVLQQSPLQVQPQQNMSQQQSPQQLAQQQSQQRMSQQKPQQVIVQQQSQHLSQQILHQPQPQQQSMAQQPTEQLGQQQPTQTAVQQQLPQQTVQQQSTQPSVQQQQIPQSVQQQPSQQSVQAQSQQPFSPKSKNQQSHPHQQPQHQKSWPEPTMHENPTINGTASVQNPQVTLNTSNGSVTIMAQLKTPPIVSSTLAGSLKSPGSPNPMNGKPPEPPRPQGIHPNLPRTVLPKSPFVNGKSLQKSIQQKNISGQRLNNNLPEGKNGLIQQSNINNRLPTFQKNGGVARKAGIPGGAISNKTGHPLDHRIQQLYNSGQANKPPSPGGKTESRLASWLNTRFKTQPTKEEPESTTPPSPPATKEGGMQRYKRKLQEMKKVQEICEITQENPKPDDAKRRREVTPDVSIELLRAADMKKLDSSKKEKRPMPGLKSIQEVGAKRKKEEDSALDLSCPQVPWLLSRPPKLVPTPRPT